MTAPAAGAGPLPPRGPESGDGAGGGSDGVTTSTPPSETRIERADPRARRRALALTVLGAAIGALILAVVESQLPALRAWIDADPSQATFRVRLVTSGFTAAIAVPTLIFAAYFWRLGGRVVRSDRFPPPGMRVVRDTVVWRGKHARRRGRMLQALALVLGLAVGGFVTILWRLASLVRSRTE